MDQNGSDEMMAAQQIGLAAAPKSQHQPLNPPGQCAAGAPPPCPNLASPLLHLHLHLHLQRHLSTPTPTTIDLFKVAS